MDMRLFASFSNVATTTSASIFFYFQEKLDAVDKEEEDRQGKKAKKNALIQ